MTHATRLVPLTVSAICTAVVVTSDAATITGESFGTTSYSVNFADAEDWGYLNGSLFGASSSSGTVYTYDGSGISNRHSSGSMGTVTLTEDGTLGSKSAAPFDATFTNGVGPVNGSSLAYGGAFGDHRAEDLFTFTFNDVGAGDHTLQIYIEDNRNSMNLEFTTNITATDGNVVGSVSTGSMPTENAYVFTLAFSTNDPLADVSIAFVATSAGSGESNLGAFVLNTVPEPGSLALLGLGGFLITRRRHD